MPTASVLLCVRNGAKTLERQLAALAAQDHTEEWELLLVDNGSTDATRDIATRWLPRVPNLRIVNEPRRGLNCARNRGVCEARAPIIACCDADDEVAPEWLRAMAGGLDRFDIVGGALDPYRLSPSTAPREACLQRTELPTVFGLAYAVGANFGFRTAVFDQVGGFDESFEVGSDEVDFCLRAQYAGCSIGFVADALVHYRVRDTARAVIRQRLGYGRGHERLVAKHARLRRIDSRLVQRWKIIAVRAAAIVTKAPQLLDRFRRLQYLASVAYLSGRAYELGRETVDSWVARSRNAKRPGR